MINRDKTEAIPLTQRASTRFNLQEYGQAPFGQQFTHLGVKLQQGGRDMAAIEKEILDGLRRTVATWNKRRLHFTGRVNVANTYMLSKIWHVAPFYDFSSAFFTDLDRITKTLLWDGNARVSLAWFRRPKSRGGWGLLDPKTQCAALKAKWLARWRVENPKWSDLFVTAAKDFYGHRDDMVTRTFLQVPPKAKAAWVPRGGSPTIVSMATKAFASLDVKRLPAQEVCNRREKGADTTFGSKGLTVNFFTVREARRTMDQQLLEAKIKKPRPQAPSNWAPIFANMRLYDVFWPREGDLLPLPAYPDKIWSKFYERLHAPERHVHEKDFLYMLAHNVIYTNGIKGHFGYDKNKEIGVGCRRCKAERPEEEPPVETRMHAFYSCPSVYQLWETVRGWLAELFPTTFLSTHPHMTVLGWPDTPKLESLAVHIHSVASHAVWVTHCKLGDDEKLATNELQRYALNALRYRGRIEWERALHRDRLEAERATASTTGDRRVPDTAYKAMKEKWHYPPLIV
ncbi:hypothetical protein BGW38_008102, partial [Lunasporangiospora selenospora]